ncbi:MAG: hypothetical protein AB4041_11030 [Microcystaceae cyanobacterium]
MTDATQLTTEEIQQYKKELAGNAKALEDINLIERCDGDLEYAAVRLVRRRSTIDTVKADEEDFWQQIIMEARLILCQDGVRDNLAPNFLGGLIGFLSASNDPLLVVAATPLAIYIVKETIDEFCSY